MGGQMTNKLTLGRLFFFLLVPAFTTGMGNGSVFGAAVMCAVGRGSYGSWGGWHWEAYNPGTFSGFVDWMMILFGLAFAIITLLAMRKHGIIQVGDISAFDNQGRRTMAAIAGTFGIVLAFSSMWFSWYLMNKMTES